MRDTVRRRVLAGLAVVAATWCTGQVLHRGTYGQPESLVPNQSGVKSEQTIMLDLFEGLTTYAADGRTVPGAAERWSVAADGRLWTFHLRDKLRWSDGTALTARDWIYAWQRMFTPATALPRASRLLVIHRASDVLAGRRPATDLGVSAPDARTVVIQLEHPLPWLPDLLAGQEGTPLPRHAIERFGSQWTRPGNLVGNGAFKLVERRAGGNLRLERNPHYHDAAKVRLAAVVYVPSDDTRTLVNRFRAGELQVNGWPGFPPRSLTALRAELGAAVRVTPLAGVRYLRFNLRQPPFDDLRVRRALSLAVDREQLARKVLGSGERGSVRALPDGLADDLAPPSQLLRGTAASRLQEARQLLLASGLRTRRNGPIRLQVPSGNGEELCLAVAAMWTAAGAPTVVEKSEIKSLIADLRQGRFDVALTGAAESPAKESYLERFLPESSYNTGGYANPQFIRALRAAQQQPDPPERRVALRGAEAILNADHAIVPLIQEVARNLVSTQVGGWEDNRDDYHLSRYLTVQQNRR